MILPDLAKRVAWYQEHLRPEDPAHGTGISDWTITAEYRPGEALDAALGSQVWGCMGSPLTGGLTKLTPEDITAKRAHVLIRTPRTPADLAEVDRTLIHELGHCLAAGLQLPRDAEEEVMHSLDHLCSKLLPEEGLALARALQNPMARAFRAEATMPEPNPTEPKPEEKKPMAQEGPRDVAAIQADIVKAVLAGQPVEELAKELVAAQALAGAGTPEPASTPEPPMPPAPPTMGMKPEEAYQRVQAAQKEAIEAIIEANPHLTKEQASMARKQATAKDARELVATYPRPANQNDQATLGMRGNPKTDGQKLSPMARAMKDAEQNPMIRKILGMGSLDNDGVHLDIGNGVAVYIDGTERLNHQRAVFEARQKGGGAA